MTCDPEEINGKKIAVFLIAANRPHTDRIYKITGTAAWDGEHIEVQDVDWGKSFILPNHLHPLICETDKQLEEIVPGIPYAVCMPLEAYPHHKEC
jgi:hypothetical protein